MYEIYIARNGLVSMPSRPPVASPWPERMATSESESSLNVQALISLMIFLMDLPLNPHASTGTREKTT